MVKNAGRHRPKQYHQYIRPVDNKKDIRPFIPWPDILLSSAISESSNKCFEIDIHVFQLQTLRYPPALA